jgi:hypothetical protein
VPEQTTTRHRFQDLIHADRHAVWDEIMRTDRPIPACLDTQMHVGRLAMRSWDGRCTSAIGEILQCDPPRRFPHTFAFTAYDDPECKLVYDLDELYGGVA